MVDNLDKKILAILKKNSRLSYVEIADTLQVSEGTIRTRVRKMVNSKVISGFTIKTNSENLKAMVVIKTDASADSDEIADELLGYGGVTEVYDVAGEQDMIASIEGESKEYLNDIIERIRHNRNIVSTRTWFVLKEHFGEN